MNKLSNNIIFKNPDKDPNGAWISTNATYTDGGFKYGIKLPNGEICIRNRRFSENDFKKGKIPLYFNKGNVPRLKVYEKDYEKDTRTPGSLILNLATSTNAKNDLGYIFDVEAKNIPFDTPKPVDLIKYLLKISTSKSSTILDFFAGSGTTGHAVLELNKEDGGNRQFILCSNRENTKENPDKNICKDITYERNKRVIQGYTNAKGQKIEGLGGNLRYYTTQFIPIEPSIDDLRYKFIDLCDDLLCIKENTFEYIPLTASLINKDNSKSREFEVTKQIPLKIYKNNHKYTVVLYDIHYFDQLLNILKNLKGPISVYIFSINKEIYEEEISHIKSGDITIQNIPDEILQVYKKIFYF